MSFIQNKKLRNWVGRWLTGIVLSLFLLIVVSVSYLTQGTLLHRANQVIDLKTNAMRRFVEAPLFREGIVRHATQNQSLSRRQISTLDNKWIKQPEESKILEKLLANTLSQKLHEFTRVHPEFKEVFITDARGLVVALTNPTSDYDQADEGWWNQTFQKGNYVADIEYDESAHTSFYGIYQQIRDEEGHVIGILKGVLDAYDVRMISEKREKR